MKRSVFIVAVLLFCASSISSITPFQFRIYEQSERSWAYLAGVLDGVTASHDLVLKYDADYHRESILLVFSEFLLLSEEELLDLVRRRGEPWLAGRYMGHLVDEIVSIRARPR